MYPTVFRRRKLQLVFMIMAFLSITFASGIELPFLGMAFAEETATTTPSLVTAPVVPTTDTVEPDTATTDTSTTTTATKGLTIPLPLPFLIGDLTGSGFVMEMEQVYGENMSITGLQLELPVKIGMSMDNVDINGFRLFRNMNSSDVGDYYMEVKAGQAASNHIDLEVSDLAADQISIDLLSIIVNVFTGDGITSDTMAAEGLKLNTHKVRSPHMELTDFELYVKKGTTDTQL
ncbi:MAG: hypothetical protein ACOY31_10095 [Bacillota bacterium]